MNKKKAAMPKKMTKIPCRRHGGLRWGGGGGGGSRGGWGVGSDGTGCKDWVRMRLEAGGGGGEVDWVRGARLRRWRHRDGGLANVVEALAEFVLGLASAAAAWVGVGGQRRYAWACVQVRGDVYP